jgi:hypothetical protein
LSFGARYAFEGFENLTSTMSASVALRKRGVPKISPEELFRKWKIVRGDLVSLLVDQFSQRKVFPHSPIFLNKQMIKKTLVK